MTGGRIAGLCSGDVEPRYAVISVTDGELGYLGGLRGVTHGREESRDSDLAAPRGHQRFTFPEPGVDTLDDLLEGQPLSQMLLGRVPALGVDDPVSRQILHALTGYPTEAPGRLHHGKGVVEGLEIERQRARVRTLPEPRATRLGVLGRKPSVAHFLSELDDRVRTQAAIEVVMEEDLGGRLGGLRRHAITSRCALSSRNAGRHTATYSAPSGPQE